MTSANTFRNCLSTTKNGQSAWPLGMKRTVVRTPPTIVPADRAKGYGPGGLLDGGKKCRLGENDFVLLGEAGIWSCLDDL
jgi:hypothetical protein